MILNDDSGSKNGTDADGGELVIVHHQMDNKRSQLDSIAWLFAFPFI
jgi:hypothetical protein